MTIYHQYQYYLNTNIRHEISIFIIIIVTVMLTIIPMIITMMFTQTVISCAYLKDFEAQVDQVKVKVASFML